MVFVVVLGSRGGEASSDELLLLLVLLLSRCCLCCRYEQDAQRCVYESGWSHVCFSVVFFTLLLGVWVCWFATCLLDDRRFGVVWCGVVVDKNGWVIVVLSGG